MNIRSLFLRIALIVVLLVALFGLGLAARLVARLETAPNARAAHVPILLYPLVALPFLHTP